MTPRHVIAFSGGKDSSAMALALVRLLPGVDWEIISTLTGDELPEMHDHLQRMEDLLCRPIRSLPAKGLNQLIEEWQMIPTFRMRWCTRVIKIEPFIEYMETLPPGSVMYVGLRADETGRLGLVQPGAQFTVACPMQGWGWTKKDVWDYLDCQEVKIPRRTDCARCFNNRLSEWWQLWKDHPEIYANAEEQEKQIGHTFRSPQRDSWPAALKDMRLRFEAGEVPKERKKKQAIDKCRFCTM